MNKLLIALPIILFLSVGILLIKETKDTTLTSSSVTKGEWLKCRESYINDNPPPCNDNNQVQSFNEFFDATNQEINHLVPSCSLFKNTIQNDDPLLLNEYFEKCFFSSWANQITISSYCFQHNYFYPIYIKCAGF